MFASSVLNQLSHCEDAVRHPQVLDPQPALELGDLVVQDLTQLDQQLLVGRHPHRAENGDQDRPGQQQRQTAGQRIHVLLFVELGCLLIQFFLVVGILLLQGLHLGLQLRGLPHAHAALDVQWRQHQADHDGKDHHRPSPASDPASDPGQDVEKKIIHSGLFPP